MRFVDPDFLAAYSWMQEQMARRLPAYSGDPPIWAWTERPDLRTVRDADHARLVLIVFDVPPARALRSDFDAWHFVLNGVPADLSEESDPNSPPTEAMEATWEIIFDLAACASPAREHPMIQACVDRVHAGEILSRRPFTVRAGRAKRELAGEEPRRPG